MALIEGEWQASGYTLSMLSFNMHSSFSKRKDPISMNNFKKASYWPGSTAVTERRAGAKAQVSSGVWTHLCLFTPIGTG